VLGALAAGLPLVVMPLFADQPNNAARVADVGAGIALPARVVSPADIRGALSRVLEDGSFRSAAQRVAAEIAALPARERTPSASDPLCDASAAAAIVAVGLTVRPPLAWCPWSLPWWAPAANTSACASGATS
jgi:UDP:flavonoid glycosyltransferase YjiC (YdhE family)